jgi:hypothetical protein
VATSKNVVDALRAFQSHHEEHSQLFRNITEGAGGEAYTTANPVVMRQLVTPRAATLRTEADVVRLAFDVERMLASTFQADVSTFDDITFNQRVMSVGGVESGHVAYFAPMVGRPTTPDGAFQAIEGAVSPTSIA